MELWAFRLPKAVEQNRDSHIRMQSRRRLGLTSILLGGFRVTTQAPF